MLRRHDQPELQVLTNKDAPDMSLGKTAAAAALAFTAACGGTGISAINEPSAGTGSSEEQAYFKAKCKSDIGDCLADARKHCGGEYTVVHKESHAGGLLADALPGPVTWYTVSFRCGATAEETAVDAQRDALAAFVMPQCRSDWEGRCGLLTDKLEFGATIDQPALAIETAAEREGGGLLKRAARSCDERPDSLSDSCLTDFRKTFTKLLRARYPHAQDQRLLSWCERRPEDCNPSNAEKLRLLELDFLTNHDRSVFTAYERAQASAGQKQSADVLRSLEQRQRSGEEESQRQTRGQMVRDAVQQMQSSSK